MSKFEITVVAESLGKFQINENYRPIAKALIEKHHELSHIAYQTIIFGDDLTSKGKSRGRRLMAKISKMPAVDRDIIRQLTGKTYDYRMTFIRNNTEGLSAKQIIALVYHELRHIGEDGSMVGHDVEDFSNMVRALGNNWCEENKEIPDLLDKSFVWEGIQGVVLDFAKSDHEEEPSDVAAAW